jgi:hypothetical protein
MPGFDGTGPMGQGPFSGRGMGYCAVRVNPPAPDPGYPGTSVYPGTYARAGYVFPGFFRGRGRGFQSGFWPGGRGRGGRRRRW